MIQSNPVLFMKGHNSAYHQAMKDIARSQQVLVNTDVDPFKEMYVKLNRPIVGRGANSYRKDR